MPPHADDRPAGRHPRARRRDHRRGQQPLPRLPQARGAALAEKGIEWLDMGVSGGVWGLQVGFCAMLGGKREVFDRFEPVVRDAGARGRLPVLRRGRRRALHEDGPQRHRVRDHAGLRRGLRHPPRLRLRPRPRGRRAHVEQRIGHPLVAARAGRQRLREGGQRPREHHTAGSPTRARGAGRWPRRSTTTCRRRSSPSA